MGQEEIPNAFVAYRYALVYRTVVSIRDTHTGGYNLSSV
jgi:hypothetical protein